MIYGYCRKQVDDHDFFEMKGITFSMSSESLRAVSLFLKDAADMMDDGEFEKYSHFHIESVVPSWKGLCPEIDIIVMKSEV